MNTDKYLLPPPPFHTQGHIATTFLISKCDQVHTDDLT